MNTIKKLAVSLCSILTVMLAACGGGGGGDESAATGKAHSTKTGSSDVQGVYEGLVANQLPFRAILLDNDEYYFLYGDSYQGEFYVAGFLQGNGNSGNGRFTSSDMRDFYFGAEGGSVTSGSLNASYIPGTSFSGTITEGSANLSFAGSAISAEAYDYNAPAQISKIAGAWKMDDSSGNSLQLSIGTNGSFSGAYGGCTFSGTMLPRASGKNIFDMQLTFGPAPCSQPDQSAAGITLETNALETRQLISIGLNDSRSNGLFFIAQQDTASTIFTTKGVEEPIRVAVGTSLYIPIYFYSKDGNAYNLTISNLGELPAGWSSRYSSFSCSVVIPTGGSCPLELVYTPTAVTSETNFSLQYVYTDDSGANRSGTIEIAYSAF